MNRLAVIGLGSIGSRHVRTIALNEPGIEIVAVRREINHPAPEEGLVSSVQQSHTGAIAQGIDGAIICSPASQHVADALPYLDAGLPVLIEKPVSRSVGEVEPLLKHFRASTHVLIGYTFRYSDGFQWLSSWLKSGRAGRILKAAFECNSFMPEWRPGRDYRSTVSASAELGGGVLLELSHEIDMALALFGPLGLESSALSSKCHLRLPVEDRASIFLTNDDSTQVEIELDFCSRKPSRTLSIFGETETVVWDLLANSISVGSPGPDAKVKALSDDREIQFSRQLRHFLDCVMGKSLPGVTLRQGISVLEVIDMVRKSSEVKSETEF